VIALADVRAALTVALRGLELNVSDGADLVPNGAAIGGFVVNYHPTIAGTERGAMAVAGVEIRIATDRADEASAYGRMDAAMTTIPPAIERAPGPWHSCVVSTARPDSPLLIGDASYAALALVCEFYI
jgi:hypothetical protein